MLWPSIVTLAGPVALVVMADVMAASLMALIVRRPPFPARREIGLAAKTFRRKLQICTPAAGFSGNDLASRHFPATIGALADSDNLTLPMPRVADWQPMASTARTGQAATILNRVIHDDSACVPGRTII